jgi:hypothetical protein
MERFPPVEQVDAEAEAFRAPEAAERDANRRRKRTPFLSTMTSWSVRAAHGRIGYLAE